jgi:hypothetical protein
MELIRALVLVTLCLGCVEPSQMARMCEAASLLAGAIEESESAASMIAVAPSDNPKRHLDRALAANEGALDRIESINDQDFRSDDLWRRLRGTSVTVSSVIERLRKGQHEAGRSLIGDARKELNSLVPPLPRACLGGVGVESPDASP